MQCSRGRAQRAHGASRGCKTLRLTRRDRKEQRRRRKASALDRRRERERREGGREGGRERERERAILCEKSRPKCGMSSLRINNKPMPLPDLNHKGLNGSTTTDTICRFTLGWRPRPRSWPKSSASFARRGSRAGGSPRT